MREQTQTKEWSGRERRRMLGRLSSAERRLNAVHRQCAHRQLSSGPLHPNQLPLLDLIGGGQAHSQVELARILEVSPAAVAVSIKRLEKNGYVEKQADHADLRYNTITLTDQGRAVTEQVHQALMRMVERKYQGFSQEELAAYLDFNNRIIDNLETYRKELEEGA